MFSNEFSLILLLSASWLNNFAKFAAFSNFGKKRFVFTQLLRVFDGSCGSECSMSIVSPIFPLLNCLPDFASLTAVFLSCDRPGGDDRPGSEVGGEVGG